MTKIKNYLISFYKFWYKFIVGDDWIIFIGVLWCLLIVYSFAKFYIDAWYALPIFVSLLLLWSLKRAELKAKLFSIKKHDTLLYVLIWALLTLVAIVPYALFYIRYSYNTPYITSLMLPTSFSLVTIIIISLVVVPIHKIWPIIGSLLEIVVAFEFINIIQKQLLKLSWNITNRSIGTGWLIFTVSTAFAAVMILVTILSRGKPLRLS